MDLNKIKITYIDKKKAKGIISININDFSKNVIEHLRDNLLIFYDGKNSLYDFKTIYNKIFNFFNSKTNVYHLNGAVSELILLIMLSSQGFSQEYCYQDLEGGGLKKGFDGLFVKNGEIWLMESKSSSEVKVHNMKHSNTINNAYRDIKSRVEGSGVNDPWQNAYNHAIKASSEKTLIKKLQELSTKFQAGIFGSIKNENIILGSTIYNDPITEIDNSSPTIEKAIKNHEAKKQITVAINMKESKLFLNFLRRLWYE